MEDTVAGSRIAVAGDWHGNTAWAVPAVRRTGRPVSNAVRGLAGLLGAADDA